MMATPQEMFVLSKTLDLLAFSEDGIYSREMGMGILSFSISHPRACAAAQNQ
jgi:hypothetical protein